jgi:cytochrome c peroxidase
MNAVQWALAFGVIGLAACGGASEDARPTGGAGAGPGAGASGGGASALPTCEEAVGAEGCAALQQLALPASLPPARGNAHAESFEAALLGFQVFFDSRFSKGLEVRCESCHSVDYAFADNAAVPTAGLGPGLRNAPTLLNVARHSAFLWDGRVDSLWSQPLVAFENPDEMDFTRLEIVHVLAHLYPGEYESAFGPLPDLSDPQRFPSAGRPGDETFDSMSADDQMVVNGVVANLGKALEAYMRKIAAGPSRVDAYLAGDEGALSDTEARGMYAFANAGCLACHSGPTLSDDRFHNLGVPALDGERPDPGRAEAIAALQSSIFNQDGPFFDGKPPGEPDLTPVVGGFRTPSLRNLPKSGPYGHNGRFETLEEIVDFHLRGGGDPGTGGFVGEVDPLLEARELSEADRDAIVAFLRALQGAYPALPWGQWPNGNG